MASGTTPGVEHNKQRHLLYNIYMNKQHHLLTSIYMASMVSGQKVASFALKRP